MPACLELEPQRRLLDVAGRWLLLGVRAPSARSWTDLRRLAASATRSREALTTERSVSAFLTTSRRLSMVFSVGDRVEQERIGDRAGAEAGEHDESQYGRVDAEHRQLFPANRASALRVSPSHRARRRGAAPRRSSGRDPRNAGGRCRSTHARPRACRSRPRP